MLGAIACGEQPLALIEAEQARSCQLPADLLSKITSESPVISPAALRPALSHAATMSATLGPAAELPALQTSLTIMGQTFGASPEADCQALTIAWVSLHNIAPSPETLPDREGIVLVLELAARSLTAPQR